LKVLPSSVTIAAGTGNWNELMNARTSVLAPTEHSDCFRPGDNLSFSDRVREVRTGFERPFWVANVTELFERLSYYAAFASLAGAMPPQRAVGLSQNGSGSARLAFTR